MIRLLLVDDQPAVRAGLRMRLALEPDVEVIAEAGEGATALALAAALRPDLVVMDVEMPTLDGIAATAALRAAAPAIAVVILSLHDDALTRSRAAGASAAGFVAKHDLEEPLLAAIRALARPPVG